MPIITADFDGENDILVESPNNLRKENSEKVFLITSLRYFDEIAEELEGYGIKKYFSVFCMEALERKNNKSCMIGYKDKWIQNLEKYVIDTKKVCIYTDCDGAGHAKEIADNLLSLRKDIRIVWIVNKWNSQIDRRIKKVLKKNVYACEYEFKTSAIWICDGGGSGFPTSMNKEGHIGIELKHWSSVTLKKFILDEKGLKSNQKMNDFWHKNARLIDYVLVGSAFDEQTCRSGLGIKGEYVHVGSPRSDVLFRSDRKKKIHLKYPKLAEKKILLYAPTFRRTGEDFMGFGYQHELDFIKICKVLKDKFDGDWVILLRLHPRVAQYSSEIKLPSFVVDVSDYQDAEELVAASDALVTDYSSIMFEPAYINIPVFLLATDLDEYTQKERDFYIDYETLPFPIAKTNEELRSNIISFDQDKYNTDVAEFFKKYGVHEDGHAAERAAKFISDLIDKNAVQSLLD